MRHIEIDCLEIVDFDPAEANTTILAHGDSRQLPGQSAETPILAAWRWDGQGVAIRPQDGANRPGSHESAIVDMPPRDPRIPPRCFAACRLGGRLPAKSCVSRRQSCHFSNVLRTASCAAAE